MILVTGGTGLVGAHLLYHLALQKDNIFAIKRTHSNLEEVKKVFLLYAPKQPHLFDKIIWLEASLNDIPALEKAFIGITHVYHCAAFISFNPKHRNALKKTNIEGTANIVNLCLAFGIKKLAYVSSIATLGESVNHRPINEETFWNPEANNSVYSRSKYAAEMQVWRGSQEGLPIVIINPGVIIGEGFFNRGSGVLIKQIAKGIIYYPKGSTGFVDVQDVVKTLIALMNSNIKNERFIVVGHNISFKQLLQMWAPLLQQKPPQKPIAAWVLYTIAFVDYLLHTLFKTKRKLLKATVRSLYNNNQYTTHKITTTLNYKFIYLEETLQRVAKNYLNWK